MTKGGYRVGLSFNPSGASDVEVIKDMAAALIDKIDAIAEGSMDPRQETEVRRLKALAQTAIEEGAMWAVKAATKPAP